MPTVISGTTFQGDAHNDHVFGTDGNDTIVGGGGPGSGQKITTKDDDPGNAEFDKIVGSDGDDRISGDGDGTGSNGTTGADHIKGDAGDDVIRGGVSNDKLHGGDDNDVINGGNGNDRLYGGEGDDVIIGGNGNDVLFGDRANRDDGDLGSDVFVFDAKDGSDKVFDFDTAFDQVLLHNGGDATASYDYKNGNTVLFFGETKVIFYGAELTEDEFDANGVVATFDDSLL